MMEDESRFRSLSPSGSKRSVRSRGSNGRHSPTKGKARIADRSKSFTWASDTPGPGAYESRGAIGEQIVSQSDTMPKYSFGSSTRQQTLKLYLDKSSAKNSEGLYSPGPMYYAKRPDLRASTSYSLRSPLRGSGQRAESPGPGSYEQNRTYVSGEDSVFGGSWGKPRPMTKGAKDVNSTLSPGPVYYPNVHKVDGRLRVAPNFSFGSELRMADKIDSAPGPGAYSPVVTDYGAGFTGKGKHTKFGRSRRPPGQINGRDSPGPGAYYPKPKNTAPKFTFRPLT